MVVGPFAARFCRPQKNADQSEYLCILGLNFLRLEKHQSSKFAGNLPLANHRPCVAPRHSTYCYFPQRLGSRPLTWRCVSKALLQKKSLVAAEQRRPDVAVARAEWRISQLGLDPSKLIFVDET